MTMDNERISTSFGRYLQAIRIEKGMSLDTVSKETRIRLETLLQIEDEDFKKLPDEVFVKGFLRAYAKAVGADGGEAVRLYESRLEVVKKIAKSEADLKKSSKKFWPRLLLALTTLICLMVLSIMAVPYLQIPSTLVSSSEKAIEVEKKETAETHEAAAPVAAPVTAPVTAPAPKPEPQPGPKKEPVAKVPEKYLLRIETTEETWMKIIIDDKQPSEYSLFPGDHIELEANASYNILIGNAGGVKLSLNNKPVEIVGKSGQVINVQLP